jgi:hypothetical protein
MTAAATAAFFLAGAAVAQEPAPKPAAKGVWFADATDEAGLGSFQEVNGNPEKPHISGANGAGVALFDYDGDGDLDVFFVNGSFLGGLPAGRTATNHLFRNLGGGRFEDVTVAAGLDSHSAFGQGCAVADVNGDDRPDLFVTNVGSNALYVNRGDGTFTDVAAKAGVASPGFNSGATLFDYDRDGDLDLYVSRYTTLEPGTVEHGPSNILMSEWKGQRVVKGPHGLDPGQHSLYRNNGDLTFTDVTQESGIGAAVASFGFEPLTLDFDDDGDSDLFVANDSMANYLWRNNGDGTFTDCALIAGVAFNSYGRPQSNMGVSGDDFDDDGLPDLFITTFSDDAKTLFRNGGKDWFTDVSVKAGLGGSEVFRALSWGTSLFDADNDGDRDLFIANGHVYPEADKVGDGYSFGQKNFLFLQGPAGRFQNVGERAGPAFQVARSSRGSAVGDLDDDGDLDIVVNNLSAKPTLLRNESAPRGHFVSVRLRGKGLNRSAIGARAVLTAGGRRQFREVRASGSYLSHEDLRLHFGIGDATKADALEVRWPDGSVETVAAPPCDRGCVVEQGKGRVER